MAFWGVEVKPGMPFTLKATTTTTNDAKRLHLSQATLGLSGAAVSKNILQCNVGNRSPLFLCVLSSDKAASCQLNIEFKEAEDVIFSVLGTQSVHLTGYFLARMLNDDNNESVVINTDEGEETQKPETDKAIEPSTDGALSKEKRKKERRDETTLRKKQAMEKNMEKEATTKKLPESEVTIEEIEKGRSDGKVAVQGKKVSILYTGKLKDSGKVFESNLEEAPLRVRLGGEEVIKGLSNGVEGMRAGDKRRLIIPPSLGYTEEGLNKEEVPKNSWLIYEVEAVKVR